MEDLSIYQWVRDKKRKLEKPSLIVLKKVIGLCFKIFI